MRLHLGDIGRIHHAVRVQVAFDRDRILGQFLAAPVVKGNRHAGRGKSRGNGCRPFEQLDRPIDAGIDIRQEVLCRRGGNRGGDDTARNGIPPACHRVIPLPAVEQDKPGNMIMLLEAPSAPFTSDIGLRLQPVEGRVVGETVQDFPFVVGDFQVGKGDFSGRIPAAENKPSVPVFRRDGECLPIFRVACKGFEAGPRRVADIHVGVASERAEAVDFHFSRQMQASGILPRGRENELRGRIGVTRGLDYQAARGIDL